MRKRGAQPGNGNAVKARPMRGFVAFRCHAGDKAEWGDAAARAGVTLQAWVNRVLNTCSEGSAR